MPAFFTILERSTVFKMSAIVNGILNSTIGLLCSKLRDYTAQRLNEGDLNEEKCRQIVVRELDDIKSKLDGLSRKDLLASLSFFKEGVTRLYISLETSGESRDQPSTSKSQTEDDSKLEGATVESFPVMEAERDALKYASQLSQIIGNLKIASKERYNLAKESFKETRRLATEAFNNVALSTEDRVMASKLRIASRILEGLDDTEAAVRDCLLYLKELQDLLEVQAMFAVWRDSHKGFTSRLRARFNQEKRNVNIESIQMMNALLIDLTMKFTDIEMGVLKWPTIKIGKAFYHPLLDNQELKKEIEENKTKVPWRWRSVSYPKYAQHVALTSKGAILSAGDDTLLICKRKTAHEVFFTFRSDNNESTRNKIRSVAVDENDNVYIVVQIISNQGNVPYQYKLLILNTNGEKKGERFLPVIDEKVTSFGKELMMSLTKDGIIVIYSKGTMCICDSGNIKQDYTFTVPFKDVCPQSFEFGLTVTNKHEIIFTFYEFNGSGYTAEILMYIITMDGKIKREVQISRVKTRYLPQVNVVFNHVNETIFVSCFELHWTHVPIYIFSNTGEFLRQFDIPLGNEIIYIAHGLVSHPNGLIAFFRKKGSIMIQM